MQIITGLIYALIGSMIFYSEKGFKIFIKFAISITVLSAIIAIMQYLQITPAFLSWTKYESHIFYGAAGLELSPVTFSYSMLCSSTLILCTTFKLN